jgi:hypothetical protein
VFAHHRSKEYEVCISRDERALEGDTDGVTVGIELGKAVGMALGLFVHTSLTQSWPSSSQLQHDTVVQKALTSPEHATQKVSPGKMSKKPHSAAA